MKRVLFVIFAAALAASAGCASAAGYTGLTGLSAPGYEAAAVVAANQILIRSIAGQTGWPFGVQPYGQPLFSVQGYGNVPVCRVQDLVGLPPIRVSQPVVVRVSKSRGHQTKDLVGGAAVGAGLGYFSGGPKGAAVGAGAGAGGGLLVANHEQDFCLLFPAAP